MSAVKSLASVWDYFWVDRATGKNGATAKICFDQTDYIFHQEDLHGHPSSVVYDLKCGYSGFSEVSVNGSQSTFLSSLVHRN